MTDHPRGSPLRTQPAFERSREEGRSAPAPAREGETIPDRNELSGEEALALVRRIRAQTLVPLAPDSTPWIRADRDGERE